MTNNTSKASPTSGVADPSDARDEAGVRVEIVDPDTVSIEDNIRSDEQAPRWLVKSVRDHGVLVPVLAYPGPESGIVVRDGKLRTLAAREAAVPLPAFVVPEDDQARATVAKRIIQQYVTNEHRSGLSNADRAQAWQQLALAGMSVTAISRTFGTKPKEIKAGLAVAGSEVAKTVAAEHDLTLEQAAAMVEFDGDEHAQKTLTTTARKRPDQFDHTVQRLRDERERTAARQGLVDQATTEHIPVIEWPSYNDNTIAPVVDLQDEDGTLLTIEEYKNRPNTPGLVAAISNGYGEPRLTYFVDDFRRYGLRKITGNGPTPRKMNEAEKAERKQVVANNKAWDSATKVRETWLKTFLTRKRLPAEAPMLVALTLTRQRYALARAVERGNQTAHRLLGIEPGVGDRIAATLEANPGRAGHVALAVVLGAREDSLSRASWRSPDTDAAYYLKQLAAWGYDLSDVERIITDDHQPVPEAESDGDDDQVVAGAADAGGAAGEEADDEVADPVVGPAA